MRWWLPVAVLLLCLAPYRPACADDAGAGPGPVPPAEAVQGGGNPGPVLTEKLIVGGITISYPRGLESQAQQVAEVCKTVVAPRREKFRAMQRAFSDGARTARVLAQLLGLPEAEGDATRLIAGVGQVTTAFVEPMFADVRVYRESDLKASGGVSGGAISLTYLPREDRFQLQMGIQASALEGAGVKLPTERSFLPVLVRDDGTFRNAEKGPAAGVGDMLDIFAGGLALHTHFASIQMAANLLLARQCGPQPFTRWFHEGVAQWATPRVVQEIAPDYVQQCREVVLPEAPTPEARARVNLLAWPSGEDPRPRDAKDEESAYCAYELIERLLRDRPPGTLAAVVGKLQGQEPLDTEAILRALDTVLGGDSRSLLLEYVPDSVRTGLREGRPAGLREEGYRALTAADYGTAVKLLSDALEMAPSDADMRVNLAIAMRRSGIPRQGSERQIRLAAVLAQAQPGREFALQGKADDETWYVLGRVAQVQERTKEAKELLGKLPASHTDGQAALKDLESAGGSASGAATK